ncbi:MAG: MBL fold metallo-hydrolase [Chitinophagaceae bacterium]
MKQENTSSKLNWKVITVQRQGLNRDPKMPAGHDDQKWVVNTSTLIYGEQDAVLVDCFLTIDQTNTLIEAIDSVGRELKYIYITHPHGDHVFGVQLLLDRFPNAIAISTKAVSRDCDEIMKPEVVDSFWRTRFPDQIPEKLTPPQGMDSNEIILEGHKLVVVETGFTDTHDTTSLFVPSIGLLVAGDVVYNGIYLFLGETTPSTRAEWIASLDKLAALHPQFVIAGHKNATFPDNPENIAITKKYLEDFERLNEETITVLDLYNKMLELYPDRGNIGSLWGAATRAKENLL